MTVSLTSYVIAPNTSLISQINSVCLPDGRQPPSDLFTALYGARDVLVALKKAHQIAKQQGLSAYRADLKVQAGADRTSSVDSNLALSAVLINLARLKKDFEAALIQQIAPGSTGQPLAEIIDADPNLPHKLFDCPDLPVVNVIVWPATYTDEEKLQVATVKDLSQISITNTNGSFAAKPAIAY
jgi:hypothetical protein